MSPERRPLPRFNAKLAEQFGITPGVEDHPRERVSVSIDQIPTPPGVEMQMAASFTPSKLNREEAVLHVLSEEMDELSARLERFSVTLSPADRQQLVDTAMALLSGAIAAGSAVSGRR